jgi:hypothetical protein
MGTHISEFVCRIYNISSPDVKHRASLAVFGVLFLGYIGLRHLTKGPFSP